MALVNKNFSDIITFTRASTATFFNSAGVLTSAAINAPRFDYDPSTLAARGLLIEESRTNSIRNNTMVGAAAGTPGTLPTNWSVSSSGSLTQTIVGTGAINGINYIDISFTGVANTNIAIDLNPIIPASIGQTWTLSMWTAVVSGSIASLSTVQFNAIIYNSNPATISTSSFSGMSFNTTSTLVRTFGTFTTTIPATAYILPQMYVVFNPGLVNITLRIGLPQLELGAFATSVIPTTVAAVTRAADVASVNTLSPWYNAVEGTLFVEASPQASNVGGFNLAELSTDVSNRIGLYKLTSTGNASLAVLVGGATQASTNSGAWTATGKLAGAYATNDFASSLNGSAAATDTSGTVPSVTTLTLGRRTDGANVLNGYLRRITYWPRRLANAELQAVTS